MSKVISIHPAKDFKARSKAVLDNEGQRKNFRGAMDFLQAKRRQCGNTQLSRPKGHRNRPEFIEHGQVIVQQVV